MQTKYRVYCWRHRYDTLHTIDSKGTAINAARMHALLPCDKVEITGPDNKAVEWKEKEQSNGV